MREISADEAESVEAVARTNQEKAWPENLTGKVNGRDIAFRRQFADSRAVYLVPAIDGAERKLAPL